MMILKLIEHTPHVKSGGGEKEKKGRKFMVYNLLYL
jgi:hypothetical protein